MNKKQLQKKRDKLGFLKQEQAGLRSPWWQSAFALLVLFFLGIGCFEVGWTIGGWLRIEKDRTTLASVSEEGQSETGNSETDENQDNDGQNEAGQNEATQGETTQDGEHKDANSDKPDEASSSSPTEKRWELAEEYVKPEPIPQPKVSGKRLIALTFDDGPSPATTPRLLDILREKQVKATFFVTGNMAQRSPNLIQRQIAEGHQVGSHTMAHKSFSLCHFRNRQKLVPLSVQIINYPRHSVNCRIV